MLVPHRVTNIIIQLSVELNFKEKSTWPKSNNVAVRTKWAE